MILYPVSKSENSGSLYYNYKSYFSLVLTVLTDANFLLFGLIFEVMRNVDSRFFKNLTLYYKLTKNILNIPEPKLIEENGTVSLP